LDSKRQSTPPEGNKETRSGDFSFWHAKPDRGEDEISDPGEIMLFPRTEAEYQAFLLSQMRLNDELARALTAVARRRIQNLLFPFRTCLALITHNLP
jgi:hypothetical protein